MTVYLASPYRNHPGGRQIAFEEICSAGAAFVRARVPFYAPIAQMHHVAMMGELDPDGDMWVDLNDAMLARCVAVHVVKLSGYTESVGIKHEVALAKNLNIPVSYGTIGQVPDQLRCPLTLSSKPGVNPNLDIPQTAAEYLRWAAGLVDGPRNDDYGNRHKNFTTIAGLWTSYLGVPIDPVDVGHLMALLKLARHRNGKTHPDNWLDALGYLSISAEIGSTKVGDSQ